MANKGLFASALAKFLPAADALNREDAPAYAYGPEHKLAQLAATGTLPGQFLRGCGDAARRRARRGRRRAIRCSWPRRRSMPAAAAR